VLILILLIPFYSTAKRLLARTQGANKQSLTGR